MRWSIELLEIEGQSTFCTILSVGRLQLSVQNDRLQSSVFFFAGVFSSVLYRRNSNMYILDAGKFYQYAIQNTHSLFFVQKNDLLVKIIYIFEGHL